MKVVRLFVLCRVEANKRVQKKQKVGTMVVGRLGCPRGLLGAALQRG